MVEVTSGDMFFLFEAADAVFDNERMANDFKSDGTSTLKRGGRVAGTTEVDVGKSVGRGSGESWSVEILLKTKVILEKDIVERR